MRWNITAVPEELHELARVTAFKERVSLRALVLDAVTIRCAPGKTREERETSCQKILSSGQKGSKSGLPTNSSIGGAKRRVRSADSLDASEAITSDVPVVESTGAKGTISTSTRICPKCKSKLIDWGPKRKCQECGEEYER